MISWTTPQGGAHLPQLAILTLFVTVGIVVGRTALEGQLDTGSSGVSPSSSTLQVQTQERSPLEFNRAPVDAADTSLVVPLDTLATLELYWGSEWPQVKQEVFGEELEAAVQSVLMPWEQSSELHLSGYRLDERHQDLFYRRLMKWPGREFSKRTMVQDAGYTELNAQNLATCTGASALRGMPNHVIQQFDLDLNGLNDDLDGRIREFMSLLDRAIELEFNSGGLVRAPLRMRDSKPNPDAVFGRSVRGNGWQSRLEVTGERYPYLADLHMEINFLRETRKASLASLVAVEMGQN